MFARIQAALQNRNVRIVFLIAGLIMGALTCIVFVSLVFLAGRFTAGGGGLFATGPSADIIKNHSWVVIKTTRILLGTQVDRISGTGTGLPWPEDSYTVDLLFGEISQEVNLYVTTSHGVVKVTGSKESALEMWRRIKDGGRYVLVMNSQNQIVAAVEATPQK